MNAARMVQSEIVQADFQQSLEAFYAGHDQLALKHAEDGLTKLREFIEAGQGTPSAPSATQLTIDINPETTS